MTSKRKIPKSNLINHPFLEVFIAIDLPSF